MSDFKSYSDPDTLKCIRDSIVDTDSIQTAVNTDELVSLMQQMIKDAEQDRQTAKKSFIIQTCISATALIAAVIAAVAAVISLF